MTSIKWFVFITLLCATVQGEIKLMNPYLQPLRTKEMNISQGILFPFGLNASEQLIGTASKNGSHIQINLYKYDAKDPVTQCAIPLSSMKNDIIGKLNAATSDNEIVIWGETSTENVGDDKRTRFEGIRVNPGNNCKATPMTIGSYQLPKDFFVPLKPTIISNNGEFHILHHQQQDCPSCQFQEKDASFVPTHEAKEGKPSKNFLMKRLHLVEADDGYVYAYNYDNGTAVMRYLDAKDAIINQKYFDHPIDVIDHQSDKYPVSMCYEEVGKAKIICSFLDDEMRAKSKVSMDLMEGHILMGLILSSLGKNSTLVGTLQAKLGESQKYIVYFPTEHGIEALNFGELDENRVGEVDSWISETDGFYCFHMRETETLGDLEARHVVKCMDLSYQRNG